MKIIKRHKNLKLLLKSADLIRSRGSMVLCKPCTTCRDFSNNLMGNCRLVTPKGNLFVLEQLQSSILFFSNPALRFIDVSVMWPNYEYHVMTLNPKVLK